MWAALHYCNCIFEFCDSRNYAVSLRSDIWWRVMGGEDKVLNSFVFENRLFSFKKSYKKSSKVKKKIRDKEENRTWETKNMWNVRTAAVWRWLERSSGIETVCKIDIVNLNDTRWSLSSFFLQSHKKTKTADQLKLSETYLDPKLWVFRWPDNFVGWPLFSLIELDLAGDTFSDAIPDSRLQKLLALWFIEDEAFNWDWFFGGGSSFKDFLQVKFIKW